jgi:GNAT superfamily N-acetyltransferase
MSDAREYSIRPATVEDSPLILRFIRELADYERLLGEVTATETLIRQFLFGDPPRAEALIGEFRGDPVGFALFFHNFSTFVSRPGIYIEDIYVRPEFRGRGFGKAFFVHLAQLAIERGCGRIEWAVLTWNEPAIEFYLTLGARPMDEWKVFRLDSESFRRLAGGIPRE